MAITPVHSRALFQLLQLQPSSAEPVPTACSFAEKPLYIIESKAVGDVRGANMAYPYLTSDEADASVLTREVPWETYSTARLITDKDLQLIKRYDKRSEELRTSMLDEVQTNPARTLKGLFDANPAL
jgi:V-ATPase subunit H